MCDIGYGSHLTCWDLNKIPNPLQPTFSYKFCRMKTISLWFKWSVFHLQYAVITAPHCFSVSRENCVQRNDGGTRSVVWNEKPDKGKYTGMCLAPVHDLKWYSLIISFPSQADIVMVMYDGVSNRIHCFKKSTYIWNRIMLILYQLYILSSKRLYMRLPPILCCFSYRFCYAWWQNWALWKVTMVLFNIWLHAICLRLIKHEACHIRVCWM